MTGPIDSRVPAGWTRQELAELSDRELLDIVRSLPRFSQQRMAACELLVSRYRALVWSCVQRYRRGPEPAEELMQVGYVGLVAAINSFDPAVGAPWPPMLTRTLPARLSGTSGTSAGRFTLPGPSRTWPFEPGQRPGS